MPTIGSFRQDDLFGQEGILETPTLKARIKFVPLRDRSGKQPDYRILAGKREIGAPGRGPRRVAAPTSSSSSPIRASPPRCAATSTGTRAVPPSSGPADPDGPGASRGFSRLRAESGASTPFLCPSRHLTDMTARPRASHSRHRCRADRSISFCSQPRPPWRASAPSAA